MLRQFFDWLLWINPSPNIDKKEYAEHIPFYIMARLFLYILLNLVMQYLHR